MLSFSIIALGFSCITAQVLLMRELAIVFYGNELALGVMLGNWLLWTAVGSGLLGRVASKSKHPVRLFARTQIALAFVLPASLFAVRISKLPFERTIGEITGFVPMFLVSFGAASLFCLLSGFLFAVGCHATKQFRTDRDLPGSIGRVYVFEAVGAGIGGILFTFLLVRYLDPFQIALAISALSLLSAGSLLASRSSGFLCHRAHRGQRSEARGQRSEVKDPLLASGGWGSGFWLLGAGFLLLLIPLLFWFAPQLERASNRLLWKGESVHFALLEHPDPRRVLLIGGGIGGGLEQALLHPSIQHVDYVELDPKVIELGRHYLPPGPTALLDDPRVSVHTMDGRRFVQTAQKGYDVVLIVLPAPFTIQLNRLYTLEFYRQVRKILNEGGVFSFGVVSSENYIGDELSDFLSSMYATLHRVFPNIVVVPGDTNHFIACTQAGVLTRDPGVLIHRLEARRMDLRYLNAYYLPYRMSFERQQYLRSRLGTAEGRPSLPVRINRDFEPIGYYYDMVLWSTYFSPIFRKCFRFAAHLDLRWIALFCLGMLIVFVGVARLPGRKVPLHRSSILLTVMAVGFSELAMEVIAILGFQTAYGYVYHQIGLIVASYMIGLAIGGGCSTRSLKRSGQEDTKTQDNRQQATGKKQQAKSKRWRSPFRTLVGIQFLILILPLALILFLSLLPKCEEFALLRVLGRLGFPLFVGIAGFLGGIQFPIANKLYLSSLKELPGSSAPERTVGSLYAMDLVGSCIGAFITSALLIPILGIAETCIALVMLNLAALGGLLLAHQ
jgi:spermidine synthase